MEYISIFITIIAIALEVKGKQPLVTLPQGQVQGRYLTSDLGRTYEAFLGVPYAQAPIGDLRFKIPQQAKPWLGVYNASRYGSDCIQFTHFSYSIVGSEDCLFINIYKPVVKKDNLDVIVHIHGGAFLFLGAKDFRPDNLMDSDVIFVSFNYRLAPIGFISTGDPVLPGNLGLKDQAFALRWIKENIKHFGGNPESVTITGLSAGGVSVHLHYLSPLSRGLFHRGISTSGSVLNPWALAVDVPLKTKKLAASVGCPTEDSKILVDCLNTRPAEQLVAQIPSFLGWMYNPFTPIGPIVEPEGTEDPFLPRHPYDMIKDKEFTQVPWLISMTTHEGLYPSSEFVEKPKVVQELEENWDEIIPHLLDFNFTVPLENQKHVSQKIRSHYLKEKPISEATEEFVHMVGDRLFGAGIVQAALMHATASSEAPVYAYIYSYHGKHSTSEAFSKTTTNLGVNHGDDACTVLRVDFFKSGETKDDRDMRKRLRHLWTSFAKTGVPEFFDKVPLEPVEPGTKELKYLSIRSNTEATTVKKENVAHVNFWASLPIEEKLQLPEEFNRIQDEL